MKLEDQIVSLELSKKLKELGVKQESYFSWEVDDLEKCYYPKLVFSHTAPERSGNNLISSFTVAELGEMLPASLEGKSASLHDKPIIMQKTYERQFYIYGQNENGSTYPIFCDDTEANARAKMLIYLLENRLIDVID